LSYLLDSKAFVRGRKDEEIGALRVAYSSPIDAHLARLSDQISVLTLVM